MAHEEQMTQCALWDTRVDRYFSRSFQWETVSNALLKSNIAMSTWVPESKEDNGSCMVVVFHKKACSECFFKVGDDMVADDVHKKLTWNRRQLYPDVA